MVSTLELHLLELLLNILFDGKKFRFFTLHWTHAGLIMKLFQTLMVISVFAGFAFYGFNENCLAKGA